MASSSEPSPNGGLHVLVDELKLTDPTAFRAQQVNIILALRERKFKNVILVSSKDLVWTDYVTTGSSVHKSSKLVVILWERLDDFIFGEEHHPLYPCRFNVKIIRRNLPNSLRSPRAHSAALVIRFDLLPSILHCPWFSPIIISYTVFLATIHWSNYLHMSFINIQELFVRDYMPIYVIQGSSSIIHCFSMWIINTDALTSVSPKRCPHLVLTFRKY